MMKIYCERGGFRSELRQLQMNRKITLVEFPYDTDDPFRARSEVALPATSLLYDLVHISIHSIGRFLISDFQPSDQYKRIVAIVGRNNHTDILHIDSAYKSGCSCFITRDKDDILSKRDALEKLLGIQFFHPDDDWNKFQEFLREHEVIAMKLSARNILKGTVKQVNHGAVDSEVVIELSPGVNIVSIITKQSAEELGLQVGDSAYAIIKAPNVIIGVD